MIAKLALPPIGIAAIGLVAVLSLVSGGGSAIALSTLAVLTAGAIAVSRTRRRTQASGVRASIERLGGCGLGPGVAVHAVRVADRVLIVGVSGSSVTLLERTTVDEIAPAEIAEIEEDSRAAPNTTRAILRWIGRGGLAILLLSGAVLAAPEAYAQSDSPRQSADLAPAGRSDRQSKDPQALPAIDVPPAPPVEMPVPGATPLGPMLWLAGLAVLPFALMGVTSFVKISVVLSLLRSALGTPQVPSDPLLAGIALSLTTFVMAPVASEAWSRVAAANADLSTTGGVVTALTAAAPPIRQFLERNARPDEIGMFVSLSTRDGHEAADPGSFGILVPAFVTSELREAFVAGFFLFIPFLVVDLVVSNILMSMGMVMVSPTTVSLPFKVLLFVLVDGWPLLAKALALSYH